MAPFTLLLIQCRSTSDPMLLHELRCIESRCKGRDVHVVQQNAVHNRPDPTWLKGVDALIIGGSGNFSLTDPANRAWMDPIHPLIDEALQRDLPGFGICFGHQLLGDHFGVSVAPMPSVAIVGTVQLNLTDAGSADPVFSSLGRTFSAQTGHSDHVPEVPAELDLLVTGEHGSPNQAFRVRGSRFYSTQFHIDLTGEEARARYLAVQPALPAVGPTAHEEAAKLFVDSGDEACLVLGQFIDLAMT
jgi:GMP synthase (glutamine-hydrolysing)